MSTRTRPLIIRVYYKLISYDKIRFLIIGGLGFVVNYLMLAGTFQVLRLPIAIAQVLSAETAVLATFFGNSFWTFGGHHHQTWLTKFIKFHISAIGGLIINSSCVILLVHYAHLYYGLALVVGSMVALLWNYTLYKHFVFKKHRGPAGPSFEAHSPEA